MSDDVLIRVENVSKKFCRSLKRSLVYGLTDLANEAMGRHGKHDNLRTHEFWAVKDVSFELKRGECLGLIGRNGAVKTTLLRMLNGLIKPDHGRITMRGRVGVLIALGAGFNPILTGRENIYVNASVLGLTKREIDEKIEEIIDFAEIGEFIDSPVQSYSSGMQVRLGFAVATALEPDVLLLDEVLAVGDRNFQIKCLTRLGKQLKSCAVIFVGHQMERVAQICTQTLVLDKGQIAFAGNVTGGIDIYNSFGMTASAPQTVFDKGIVLKRIVPTSLKVAYGTQLGLSVEFESNRAEQCILRIIFLSQAEEILAEWNSHTHGKTYEITQGSNILSCEVPRILLRAGAYRVNVVVHPTRSSEYLLAANNCFGLEVEHRNYGWYPVQF